MLLLEYALSHSPSIHWITRIRKSNRVKLLVNKNRQSLIQRNPSRNSLDRKKAGNKSLNPFTIKNPKTKSSEPNIYLLDLRTKTWTNSSLSFRFFFGNFLQKSKEINTIEKKTVLSKNKRQEVESTTKAEEQLTQRLNRGRKNGIHYESASKSCFLCR